MLAAVFADVLSVAGFLAVACGPPFSRPRVAGPAAGGAVWARLLCASRVLCSRRAFVAFAPALYGRGSGRRDAVCTGSVNI